MSEHSHTSAYLQPGQRLAKFEIRRLMGRGGATDVYRAFDPGLDREVAIKVLHPQGMDDPSGEAEQRFWAVIEPVARLRHPNIISIFDYGIVDHAHYYVAMELIAGSTLRDHLSERRMGLPFDWVTKVFRQLADAVAYAHDQGVIHRDIRPGNVLLARDDRPVLTDFGVSHILSGDPHSTLITSTGTAVYMSPEQVAGRDVTGSTDVYSLGILLYEMVTGDVPFKGDAPARVFVQHMQTPPRPPSELRVDLSPRMEQTILKALAKRPEDRFVSPRDMLDSLEYRTDEGQFDTLALSTKGRDFRQQVRLAARQQRGEPPEAREAPTGADSSSRTPILLVAIVLIAVILVIVFFVLYAQGAFG